VRALLAAFLKYFLVALGGWGWEGVFVWLRFQWYTRVALPSPPTLPLRTVHGVVFYDVADWERDKKAAHPVRFFLTVTLPRALRRAAS
jgi:hypothetical protein